MNTSVVTIEKKLDMRRIPVMAKQLIPAASYPENYQRALAAIRDCANIDELKDVKDKHDAIAHYAKQAKDDRLLNYANRIKIRAFERIGEILKEIPCKTERAAAARDSGLASNHAVWSYHAAHIPKKVRDKLIEQGKPPTIKKLSDYGLTYMGNQHFYSDTIHANFLSGFPTYAEKENAVRRTPKESSVVMFQFMVDINGDIEGIMSNLNGGINSMSEIARATPRSEVARFRELLLPLIERLDELDHALSVFGGGKK